MRRTLPSLPWLIGGLAFGLVAARLALAPRVVRRAPASETTAPSTSEVRLTFSQPMDEVSVTTRLHITPSRDGETTWDGTTLMFRPAQAWVIGETVEVWLDAGARSRRGLTTWAATHWSFTVREPRLAYLWPAGEAAEVYTLTTSDSDAVKVTTSAAGVDDFTLGARGTQLVYTAERGAGETDLRAIDLETGQDRLLFSCPAGERCSSPVLSPDGRQLAFVRAGVQAGGNAALPTAATRVWLLTLGAGPAKLIGPEGDAASTPFWSPQGWLAFVDFARASILLIDPSAVDADAPLAAIPSTLGERGSWSPDGRYLVYPDIVFPAHEEVEDERAPALETHLFRWEVSSGALIDLSAAAGAGVEDAAPVFSTHNDWIILSRRVLAAGQWTAGRQLWRMRPDGSEAEALTAEPFINHGAPALGPQGTVLAYLRYDVEQPLKPAQIWWFDLETRQGSRAVEGGYLPSWIP